MVSRRLIKINAPAKHAAVISNQATMPHDITVTEAIPHGDTLANDTVCIYTYTYIYIYIYLYIYNIYM